MNVNSVRGRCSRKKLFVVLNKIRQNSKMPILYALYVLRWFLTQKNVKIAKHFFVMIAYQNGIKKAFKAQMTTKSWQKVPVPWNAKIRTIKKFIDFQNRPFWWNGLNVKILKMDVKFPRNRVPVHKIEMIRGIKMIICFVWIMMKPYPT